MEMQQVDLGFVKFEVTRQAIIAFVFGFFFLLLSMATTIIVPMYKSGNISNGFIIAFIAFFVAISILYGILAGYTMNCIIVGKCIKLSWIFSGLYIFMTVFYFLLFIASMLIPLNNSNMSKSVSRSK